MFVLEVHISGGIYTYYIIMYGIIFGYVISNLKQAKK
jgi:hypothetical protein